MNIISYKWWWQRLGGRPWTFILRDLWHKFEFIWIVGLISLGVWMGHHFDWKIVLEILGIFALGYLLGHLFWGKEYIPGQQGKTEVEP